MSEIALKATADYSAAQKAIQQHEKDIAKLTARFADMAGTSKKATKEQAALARAAKKMFDETRTPAERFNAQVARAGDLFRKGKINVETYNRAIEKANRSMQGAGQSGVAQIGAMTAGFVAGRGLTWAISKTKQLYAEWRQEIAQTGAKASEFHQQLIKDLSEAGDLAAAPGLQKFFRSIKGVSKEDVSKTYAGVRGGAPDISEERAKALAAQAARLAPTGQDLGAFGTLAGELATLAPGKTAGDIADLALATRQKAGKSIGQLTSPQTLKGIKTLQSTGAMSTEEALGFGLAAMEKDISPRVLATVAAKIAAAPKGAGRQYTAATPKERLAMLQQDPKLARKLLGDQAVQFSQITAADVGRQAAGLRQAQEGDAIARELAAMTTTTAGTQQMQLYAAKAERGASPEHRYAEFLGKEYEHLQEFRKGQMENKGPLARGWQQFQNYAEEVTEAWFGTLEAGQSSVESLASGPGAEQFRAEAKVRREAFMAEPGMEHYRIKGHGMGIERVGLSNLAGLGGRGETVADPEQHNLSAQMIDLLDNINDELKAANAIAPRIPAAAVNTHSE